MSLTVDIEKRLGAFTLVSKFETGNETMALLGASGCGKSVTLKCIAGIMRPDRGRIELDGEVLFDSEKHIDLSPQERRIGYLFQQYALFPNMTVLQNIMCGVRSGSKEEKRQKALEGLRIFQLEGLEDKHPMQLSGGQQQRVALARIMASEPRVILLDEPFSALDSFLKSNLELEMSDLLGSFKGPIIWVSHDLGECYRNCDSVCVMEEGRTGAVTDMDTLLSHPATKGAARLIGCRNFLIAEKTAEGVKLADWDISLPIMTDKEGDLVVAVLDDAIVFDKDGSCASVYRVIEDLDFAVLLLRPEAKENGSFIRAVIPKEELPRMGEKLRIRLVPEKCICL
ncbi:MAG: ATP-binding cassette domain-containing protein [Firmicutes bacterium]|nr:ATP-binding cassette domain-containing protein [Bacillota bacterium]